MITSNVLKRTFQIKYQKSTGTCFTIDIDQRQYLITARHVLENFPQIGNVEIFYNNNWHQVKANLVGCASGDIDIIVLALEFQLSPTLHLPADTNSMAVGQNLYFLGYPYGLFTDAGNLNNNFPLPFVKGAILSSIKTNQNQVECLYLDGHNNPGFSGGPVVFTPVGKKNEFKVAGVISGYRISYEPVYDSNTQKPTNLNYTYNTGIIISYGIYYAVELIKQNPIGFSIP